MKKNSSNNKNIKKTILFLLLVIVGVIQIALFFTFGWGTKYLSYLNNRLENRLSAIQCYTTRYFLYDYFFSYKSRGDYLQDDIFYYTLSDERLDEFSGDSTYVKIVGFSNQGLKKQYILIPDKIHNLSVKQIGTISGNENVVKYGFDSKVIQKVFIPATIEAIGDDLNQMKSFEKYIMLSDDVVRYSSESDKLYETDSLYISSYYHYNSLEEINGIDNELFISKVLNNNENGYIIKEFIEKNGRLDNIFYHVYGVESEYYSNYKKFYYANVSYFYNYDTNINHGYYWIDDYDYGELIDFIPDNPTREGYIFGGWYKEKECINKWDFENDRLPSIKYIDYSSYNMDDQIILQNIFDNVIYQETKLYARWVEK